MGCAPSAKVVELTLGLSISVLVRCALPKSRTRRAHRLRVSAAALFSLFTTVHTGAKGAPLSELINGGLAAVAGAGPAPTTACAVAVLDEHELTRTRWAAWSQAPHAPKSVQAAVRPIRWNHRLEVNVQTLLEACRSRRHELGSAVAPRSETVAVCGPTSGRGPTHGPEHARRPAQDLYLFVHLRPRKRI